MLLSNLDVLATAPGGVARLRELILTLAVQGKLVPQDPADEPASELLKKIRAEKDQQIAAGKIKQDKSLKEVAAETEPFDLPHGWVWRTLSDIGSWAIGSGFPIEAQGREGLPILFAKVSDMNLPGNELNILRTNHTIDDETVKKLRVNVHPAGTVIFPKIGGAIATNKRRILVRPTAIDNNCLGINPSAAISTNYLFLLLSSIDFTVYQAGTSVPALSQGTLGLIPLALPPLAEQSRIVKRVEELMRLCDALAAKGKLEAAQHAQLVSSLLGALTASNSPDELHDNWQRMAQHFDLLLDRPAAVDALEQTILQLAVRGLLVPQDPTDEPASELLKKIRVEKDRLIADGKIKRDKPLPPIADDEKPFELPVGWEWVTMDALATQITDGAHHTPTYLSEGVPFLSVKNLSSGFIDFSDTRFISTQAHQDLVKRCNPEMGDVLLTKIGTTGIAVVVDTPLSFSLFVSVALIKLPQVSVDRDFLSLVINSPFVRKQSAEGTEGVGNKNLVLRKIKAFQLPLPSLAEQSRIVARVESLRRLCADLRQRLATSQSTQAQLAEALVQELA